MTVFRSVALVYKVIAHSPSLLLSYLEAELGIGEHIHDLVDRTGLQQRFSSVEANTKIVDIPIPHNDNK